MSGGGGGVKTSETPAAGLQFQTSAHGVPVTLAYGMPRLAPNLVWYGDFTAIAHTEKQEGGKGGGGGGSNTTYTYTASFLHALCEGPVHSVRRGWVNKELLADPATKFQLLKGDLDQAVWSHLAGHHPDEALAYSETACMGTVGYELGNNASMPNHNFETVALLPLNPAAGVFDADPGAVLTDMLTHHSHGLPGFTPELLGDLSAYSAYCRAAGLLLSPALTDQISMSQVITDLMQLTNSGAYFSEGKLKVMPYGDTTLTGNGVTYKPPIGYIPNLDDDDFLSDGDGMPIVVKRNAISETGATTSDAYNQVQVKFRNRANDYREELATAQDLASIEQYGLRPMAVVEAPWIAEASVAQAVAQLILQRSVGSRNQYAFSLGWRWAMLEPTDIVTLTDAVLGLERHPVRILEIEENEDGRLSLLAEDAPPGVASYVHIDPPESGGYALDYNSAAGGIVDPVFVEPPIELTKGGSGIEIWVGVSGIGPLWGGCDVWVSYDGVEYKRLGGTQTPARVGKLTAPLSREATSLSVALEGRGGALQAATAAEAQALLTALYVGGGTSHEFMAHAGATLTGTKAYTLDGLVRGAYGSARADHWQNDPFVRLDDALVKSGPLDPDLIGKAIYFKFQSYNVFGSGYAALEDLPVYTYTLSGYGATGQPVSGLRAVAVPGSSVLMSVSWDASPGATSYLIDQSGDGVTWLRTGETKDTSWADSALFGAATRFRVAAMRGRAGTWSVPAFLNISYASMWNADPATPMWNANVNTKMWS